MFSKSLAVGALAAGCVAAAAGGAYVAVRQNGGAAQPVAVSVPVTPATPAPSAPQPVAETEAIVAPPAPTVAPAPVVEPAAVAPRPAAPVTERKAPARPAAAPTASRPVASASPVRSAPEPSREPAPVPPAREVREPAVETPATVPAPSPRVDGDPAVRPDPPAPAPQFEQLLVPVSSVIGLRVETPLSSERARVEERVSAQVTRDVIADGRVAIPAGARAMGTVTLVERGGKVKERARLGVRFHTIVLADGTELPINTEAIYREGESPSGESARKIGGSAIGGAILGALIGGKKGAIVGGATGAAGGTAVVMAGDRNAATLPSGTIVTIRLAAPVEVEVEKR